MWLMSVCILCESALPPESPMLEVTHTTPGAICADCGALEPDQRDALRTHAMTRMLRAGTP